MKSAYLPMGATRIIQQRVGAKKNNCYNYTEKVALSSKEKSLDKECRIVTQKKYIDIIKNGTIPKDKETEEKFLYDQFIKRLKNLDEKPITEG